MYGMVERSWSGSNDTVLSLVIMSFYRPRLLHYDVTNQWQSQLGTMAVNVVNVVIIIIIIIIIIITTTRPYG